MSELITKIRADLPGYTEAEEHLAAVTKQISKNIAIDGQQGSQTQLGRTVVSDLLAAGKSLDTLPTVLGKELLKRQSTELAYGALTDMRNTLTARCESLRNDVDEVLPRLNAALVKILEAARELGDLAQVATPEAAFASDRLDDGRTFAALAEDYADIRREQYRVLTKHGGMDILRSKSSGAAAVLSNLEDVYDDWAVWIQYGYLERRDRAVQRPINPSWWPIQQATTTPEFFRWALTHGAALWVPTITQGGAYADTLRDKAQQPRPERTEEWLDPAHLGNGSSARTISAIASPMRKRRSA